MKSAIRYLDANLDPFVGTRLSTELATPGIVQHESDSLDGEINSVLELTLSIQRYHTGVRTMKKTRLAIERFCLSRLDAKPLSTQPYRYEIRVKYTTPEELDERVDDLIQEMHTLGQDNQCLVEVQIKDPSTGQRWD